jgi:AcrR family transcriptional regulator
LDRRVPTSQLPSAARRADAERNRDKILAAARSAFADPEAEVSMAEIARRAGVGMATLYRNFPGRRELLEARWLGRIKLPLHQVLDVVTRGTVVRRAEQDHDYDSRDNQSVFNCRLRPETSAHAGALQLT